MPQDFLQFGKLMEGYAYFYVEVVIISSSWQQMSTVLLQCIWLAHEFVATQITFFVFNECKRGFCINITNLLDFLWYVSKLRYFAYYT